MKVSVRPKGHYLRRPIPKWLENLVDKVWEWWLAICVPRRPGWVRFCHEGALFEPGERAGLGISCLALKGFHMLNLLLPRLESSELEDWIEGIRSF